MEGGKKLGRDTLNNTDQTLELEQRKYTVQRIEEERAKKQQALDDEYNKRARRLQCKARLDDCGVLYSFSEIQEEARALHEKYQNATEQLESRARRLKDRAMLGTNLILEALLVSFICEDFQRLLDKEEQK